MAQTEAIIMTGARSSASSEGAHRRDGAHRIDHPEGRWILADLPRSVPAPADHFFDERKRILRKKREDAAYLSDDQKLTPKEIGQVESTLGAMKERFGYCDDCAKDSLLLLFTKRYMD